MTADSVPWDRSAVMRTSRSFMETRSRSSPTEPFLQTQTPLMATLSRSGSKAARVVPIADSTRPQLGSSPWMAHLSRLLRAMERPTSTASSSLSAPITSMRMSLLAPSASPISWRARSPQTLCTASANSSYAGTRPDAPDASSSTVSLVDMQPSESTRSKVVRVAARSALSRVAPSTSASVVSTTSMVARPGASMPAPLAMPPTVQPSREAVAVLCTVSVVLMAMAAASPPSADSAAAAVSMPGRSLSIGSRTPMRPVEATAISPALCSAPVPDPLRVAATFSAVAWVSWKPWGRCRRWPRRS
ncbi:hypothetical protein SF23_07620 [Streptomyces sp. MBRL 10]|nr:hypothetical protein SF23_07620 [Streptomyces sp. MBRL 10]